MRIFVSFFRNAARLAPAGGSKASALHVKKAQFRAGLFLRFSLL
jgi:hypothetical protein